MSKKFLTLNDISAYKAAFNLSNCVWSVVLRWDYFQRRTAGEQFVRAVDSISANIAEGFRRYQKKDKIRFYRIALGSVLESLDWNEKAKTRNLINQANYAIILAELKKLQEEIKSLVNFTNQRLTI